MVTDWKSIWENRRHVLADEVVAFSLGDLIRLNGWDGGAGGVSPKDWLQGVAKAQRHMAIGKGDSVLELGCGAGAFLWALRGNKKIDIAGLDISQQLIDVAKLALPGGEFFCHDLASGGGHPALRKEYDFVVANGVLHYLNLGEAKRVFRSALRLAKRTVLVSDLPHVDRQVEAEKIREDAMPPGEYAKKYASLKHTYFHPDIFQEVLLEEEFARKWDIFFEQSSLFPTDQSKLRFCVITHRR